MTRALIFGSTGAVGKALALELAHHSKYTEIRAVVRGDISSQDYYASCPGAQAGQAPAHLHVIKLDFSSHEKLRERAAHLQGFDDIYVSLGTTRATAGSAERFLEIDQELPVLLARLAVSSGDKQPAKQHILYVSSKNANASSYFLYPKSKGATEERLKALGGTNTHVSIFRPGLLELQQSRPESRMAESIFAPIITSFRHIGVRSMSAGVGEVAKAMRKVAAGEGQAGSTFENAAILQLASE
ncbi:hypothetical protein BCR37DRAFT_378678 [Protomyces lactucae-debilis]|uniref:NAD(P)-binding domain-containing protein n=1 Tax=Protomyces lactucae-debilis TaxID=2754530 RepID=A0A1Y2FKG2_PROLT|nr:uncharacterized protein BCR37DRAFT_378678 [Protomyces lactucae-debilis]ORY83706.1 hypothetical protein BCR37DRAFT_378678 [Protomyces lactucae-debilis]